MIRQPEDCLSCIRMTVFAWDAKVPPNAKLVLLRVADQSYDEVGIANATGLGLYEVRIWAQWLDDGGWLDAMWEDAYPDRSWTRTPSCGAPSPAMRARVLLRDTGICQHCGTDEDLTIDHVKPRCKGGTNDESNLQVLCRPCNSRKGTRDDSETAVAA